MAAWSWRLIVIGVVLWALIKIIGTVRIVIIPLAIALLCQAGRYWVIWALGRQWNTRVIVVPGMPLQARGPYRWQWLRHPNYVIVAIEGIALPLVHSAWITALVFTVLNAILLLRFRIPAEERALRAAAS